MKLELHLLHHEERGGSQGMKPCRETCRKANLLSHSGVEDTFCACASADFVLS